MQLISLMLPPALLKGRNLLWQIRAEFHRVLAWGVMCHHDDGHVVEDSVSLQLMRLRLPARTKGLLFSIRAVGRAWLGGSTCMCGNTSILRISVSCLC